MILRWTPQRLMDHVRLSRYYGVPTTGLVESTGMAAQLCLHLDKPQFRGYTAVRLACVLNAKKYVVLSGSRAAFLMYCRCARCDSMLPEMRKILPRAKIPL